MSGLAHRLTRRQLLEIGSLGAATLAGGLLAACGGAPAAPEAKEAKPAAQQPTTAPQAAQPKAAAAKEVLIKVSFGLDRNNLTRKMLDMLTEKKPHIKSELVERPTGAQAVYDYYATTLSAGDSSLDLLSIDVIWPTAFASAKWLVPLDDVFPSTEQKKYLDAMIWAMTVEGKVYGIPWMNDIGNMFYRKDILDEQKVQPPKTWNELVEVSRRLQKPPDLFGFASAFIQNEQLMCNILEYMWSNGGDVLNDQGEVVVNSEQNAEALDFVVNMITKENVMPPGSLTMQLDESRQVFTEGKAVFHRNWNYVWALAEGPESKVKGKIVQSPLPYFSKHGKSYTTLGGWNYAVSAFSKNRAETTEIALWLGSYEMEKYRHINGEFLPAIKAIYEDAEATKVRPQGPAVYEVAKTARSRPKHARYREFSEIVQTEVMLSITGKKSAKEALVTMDKNLKALGKPTDAGIGRK